VNLASSSCGKEVANVERRASSSEGVRSDGLSEVLLLLVPKREVSLEVIKLT
jgi:hypothetical protein